MEWWQILLVAAGIYCSFIIVAGAGFGYYLYKLSNGSSSDKKELERIVMNGLHDKARSFGLSNEEFSTLVKKAKNSVENNNI